MIAFLNSRIWSHRALPKDKADVPQDPGQGQKGKPGKHRPAAFAFYDPQGLRSETSPKKSPKTQKQNPLSHKPTFGSCTEGLAMPISSEPAPSHRPWESSYRARPRYAEFHHITTNFTAAHTKQGNFFATKKVSAL